MLVTATQRLSPTQTQFTRSLLYHMLAPKTAHHHCSNLAKQWRVFREAHLQAVSRLQRVAAVNEGLSGDLFTGARDIITPHVQQ